MLARLIVIAIVFAAVFYGWRLFLRYRDKRGEESGERRRLESRATEAVELERDPETGVYKPGASGRSGSGGPKDTPGD